MITVTFLPNAYWKHIGIGFHSWFLSGQQMSDNKQESITVNHQENILDTVDRDTWRWNIKSKLDQNHYKFLKFAESLTALSDTCRNVVEESQQNSVEGNPVWKQTFFSVLKQSSVGGWYPFPENMYSNSSLRDMEDVIWQSLFSV